MSDISTKLTYLNTTKSQLKDQINYGLPTEKQITSSTTFRNYVGSIFEAFLEALRNPDTLFTNLPKTSGSGSNITLNNTAYAPMRIILNPTAISQDGTPTPSSPQDIHTISGNNTIKVDGKNLCNGINQNVYINQTGTTCGIADDNSGLYIQVNGGNYTISTTASQARYRVGCTNVIPPSVYSTTLYNGQNKDGTSNSITIDTTGYTYLIVNATDLTKIQIEKGSTASTYEPYQEQTAQINLGELEYSKIGNYADEFYKATDSDTSLISGKWYLKKNIGKVVLDGSENWIYISVAQGSLFRSDNSILDAIINNTVVPYSNYYRGIPLTQSGNRTNNDIYISNTTTFSYVDIIDDRYTNATDFKNWLSNNNLVVYYVLATPTYTKITGELANQLESVYKGMLSYDNVTNISQINNDLAFVINASGILGE